MHHANLKLMMITYCKGDAKVDGCCTRAPLARKVCMHSALLFVVIDVLDDAPVITTERNTTQRVVTAY
jgi:hypothetical protein